MPAWPGHHCGPAMSAKVISCLASGSAMSAKMASLLLSLRPGKPVQPPPLSSCQPVSDGASACSRLWAPGHPNSEALVSP